MLNRIEWLPTRFVHNPQKCQECGRTVPRSAPGSKSGTRGTKAYFEKGVGLWLCLECGIEESRLANYLQAEQDLRARAPRWVAGMEWDVLLDQHGRCRWGVDKIVAAIAAGGLAQLKPAFATDLFSPQEEFHGMTETRCGREALDLIYWPGQEQAIACCAEHAEQARGVADAMGFGLKIQASALPRTCEQIING